jgi:hypothetical protein
VLRAALGHLPLASRRSILLPMVSRGRSSCSGPEDPAVMLLEDIRQVFVARRVDRIISQILVDELVALEGAPWSEWRGRAGDLQPSPPEPSRRRDAQGSFSVIGINHYRSFQGNT